MEKKPFRIKSWCWLCIHDPMNPHELHCGSIIWDLAMLYTPVLHTQPLRPKQFTTFHSYETFLRQKRLKRLQRCSNTSNKLLQNLLLDWTWIKNSFHSLNSIWIIWCWIDSNSFQFKWSLYKVCQSFLLSLGIFPNKKTVNVIY